MTSDHTNQRRPYDRISRINALILSELNNILLKKEIFARANEKENRIISLSRVETGRDLRTAQVYFLVMPEKFRAQTQKLLDKIAPEAQNVLAKKLQTKSKPRIKFVYDAGQKNAFAVEEILNQIKK
jgi:ribosome-binding factor A